MRAKLIKENINNILKPKSNEEILSSLEGLSPEEIIDLGIKGNNKSVMIIGLEKTNTKIFAYGYDRKYIDDLNPLNLWSFVEIEIKDAKYVITKNIANGVLNEYTLNFFCERFEPIYKQEDINLIKQYKEAADKILKLLNKN